MVVMGFMVTVGPVTRGTVTDAEAKAETASTLAMRRARATRLTVLTALFIVSVRRGGGDGLGARETCGKRKTGIEDVQETLTG